MSRGALRPESAGPPVPDTLDVVDTLDEVLGQLVFLAFALQDKSAKGGGWPHAAWQGATRLTYDIADRLRDLRRDLKPDEEPASLNW